MQTAYRLRADCLQTAYTLNTQIKHASRLHTRIPLYYTNTCCMLYVTCLSFVIGHVVSLHGGIVRCAMLCCHVIYLQLMSQSNTRTARALWVAPWLNIALASSFQAGLATRSGEPSAMRRRSACRRHRWQKQLERRHLSACCQEAALSGASQNICWKACGRHATG